MNDEYLSEYFALLNELDDCMRGDPELDSPEGIRAQEIIDQLLHLDKETTIIDGTL
jgi:hypothetical protein